jgi:catechol 2,3-dioxygenase-like lactoylglutathione lyase family enzyme
MDNAEFKLSQISVVMLGVTDVARSRSFYCDKLGLTVKTAFEGFVFLDGGSVTLLLSQALSRANQNLAGATEVVFSVNDVRAAHRALAARGVTFVQEPRQLTPTDWGANFRDPDGHLLSVFGPEGK